MALTFERIASHRPGTTLGQCFKLFAGTRRPPEPRFQGAESASWDSPPRWRHRGKSFLRPWPPAGAAAPMAVFTPPAAALRAGSALSPGRGPSLPSVHLAPQASAWSCSSSAGVAPSSAPRVPFPRGRGPASRRVSNTERCPERRGGRSSSLEVALDQRARGRFQGQKPLSAAAPGGHPSPWRREPCGPGLLPVRPPARRA